ncbi:hypothetical protein RintRC_6297 [Richelia intracellularis]|nr:hypothetical protein RintRC_6297 [Richelia intracellularis]
MRKFHNQRMKNISSHSQPSTITSQLLTTFKTVISLTLRSKLADMSWESGW